MNYIFAIVLALNCSPIFAAEYPACGDQAKQHPVYQAFNACENARAVQSAEEFRSHVNKLEQFGYCALLVQPGKENQDLLPKMCADPNGFVCSQKLGFLMNSKCQFMHLEPDDIAHTPDCLEIQCSTHKAEQKIIDSHRGECPEDVSIQDCETGLKIEHKAEIRTIERNLAYTPARVARMKKAFDRVKQQYILKLKKSTLISKKQRKMILSQIAKTKLDLPPKSTSCANTPPTGPESGIYYDRGDGNVHICIGAIATLDHQNELDLIHGFGHELSHAIDPCTLAQAFPKTPEIGITAYSGLVQCLRGGTGADGCTKSIILCNSDKGVQEACQESAESRDDLVGSSVSLYIKKCIRESKSFGACPISKSDSEPFTLNLASYRKVGEPISQLQEVFADYMGSEVVADLVSEDSKSGKMSKQDRVDGIVALASDYVGLHGRCVTENTLDVHPAPFLRLNRIIMGSEAFRKALGCEGGPPKTPGANMKCQGL